MSLIGNIALLPMCVILVACGGTQVTGGEWVPTRYRVGDYVVYRYTGTFVTEPVVLREEVVAQDGNRLRIDVSATRGDETRRWIQILTDTPENQRNSVVDALYELRDGVPVRLANGQNRDILRLYEWVVLMPDGPATGRQTVACARVIGGARYACQCETGLNQWHGEPLRFEDSACEAFLWTHGASRFWSEASGEDVLRVEVVETGRRAGAVPLPLDPEHSRVGYSSAESSSAAELRQ